MQDAHQCRVEAYGCKQPGKHCKPVGEEAGENEHCQRFRGLGKARGKEDRLRAAGIALKLVLFGEGGEGQKTGTVDVEGEDQRRTGKCILSRIGKDETERYDAIEAEVQYDVEKTVAMIEAEEDLDNFLGYRLRDGR